MFFTGKNCHISTLRGEQSLPNKNISFKGIDFILQMVYNVVVILCNFKVG